MNGFIYIIRNTVNGKVYIGQTGTSVDQRWKEHLRHSRYCDWAINRAMRKYGTDKFYIEVLEQCEPDKLNEREIHYIKLYDSTNKSKGYNMSKGGKTPNYVRETVDVKLLIDAYVNKHLCLQEVAKTYNTTLWIVAAELRNAGVQIRDRHLSARRWDRITSEQIEEAIANTESLRQAAKYAGMSYNTFRTACINNHIEYNSSKSARH